MNEESVQAAQPRNNVELMARYMVPPTAFNMLRNLEQIVRVMMSWSTITLEVFIRREFGERYLSIGRVILGILTLRFFLGIYQSLFCHLLYAALAAPSTSHHTAQ